MRGIIGGVVAIAMMSGAALAGDKGEARSYGDWTGFYFGAHIGAANMHSSIRDDDGTVFDEEGLSYIIEDNGAIYGLQIGYNRQFGAAVIGIEADYSWTNHEAGGFFDGTDNFFRTEWNGFGTVRARLGLAYANALVYATGGLAFFNLDTVGYDDPDTQIVSFDGKMGFAAGAGAEVMLKDNVSMKLEYMYLSAGEESKTCEDCVDGPQVANHDAHLVRLGVNYRLHRRDDYIPLK